jgi:hypothetical protein
VQRSGTTPVQCAALDAMLSMQLRQRDAFVAFVDEGGVEQVRSLFLPPSPTGILFIYFICVQAV